MPLELAISLKKDIIPAKPESIDRAFTTTLPLVGNLQQIDFERKEDLADQVVTAIVNKIRRRTSAADRAAAVELSNIQAAVVSMMVDNNLIRLQNPVSVATNDMGAFPDTTQSANKGTDRNGNAFTASDKAGFILYQHDMIADSNARNHLVNYVASRYTRGTYSVDAQGTVTQVTTGY